MASWILIALGGYLLLAITGVADKFFVSKIVREPVAYAFYIAASGPFSLLLIPFGAQLLSLQEFIVALLAGIFFIVGVWNSYAAIKRSTVSRVVPIQGGLVPSFSYLFAYMILGERLNLWQTSAFFFLVIGAILISMRKEKGIWTPSAFVYAAISSASFAMAAVLTKYIFDQSNFISGMVWTRMGFILVAGAILLSKSNRKIIFNAPKQAGVKNVALYYTSRATGTIGGFLQNYAVSLGSVTIVNAMQSFQFVFLLALTSLLSVYYPKILKEKITPSIIVLKLAAIVVIGVGLALLTL